MKYLLPGPLVLVCMLVAFISVGLSECHYENVNVWTGPCNATHTTHSNSIIYVNLSCPGIPIHNTPASRDTDMVVAFTSKTLPEKFTCSVSRSGNATCNLPERTK